MRERKAGRLKQEYRETRKKEDKKTIENHKRKRRGCKGGKGEKRVEVKAVKKEDWRGILARKE